MTHTTQGGSFAPDDFLEEGGQVGPQQIQVDEEINTGQATGPVLVPQGQRKENDDENSDDESGFDDVGQAGKQKGELEEEKVEEVFEPLFPIREENKENWMPRELVDVCTVLRGEDDDDEWMARTDRFWCVKGQFTNQAFHWAPPEEALQAMSRDIMQKHCLDRIYCTNVNVLMHVHVQFRNDDEEFCKKNFGKNTWWTPPFEKDTDVDKSIFENGKGPYNRHPAGFPEGGAVETGWPAPANGASFFPRVQNQELQDLWKEIQEKEIKAAKEAGEEKKYEEYDGWQRAAAVIVGIDEHANISEIGYTGRPMTDIEGNYQDDEVWTIKGQYKTEYAHTVELERGEKVVGCKIETVTQKYRTHMPWTIQWITWRWRPDGPEMKVKEEFEDDQRDKVLELMRQKAKEAREAEKAKWEALHPVEKRGIGDQNITIRIDSTHGANRYEKMMGGPIQEKKEGEEDSEDK